MCSSFPSHQIKADFNRRSQVGMLNTVNPMKAANQLQKRQQRAAMIIK
jgi:hypothetical protein